MYRFRDKSSNKLTRLVMFRNDSYYGALFEFKSRCYPRLRGIRFVERASLVFKWRLTKRQGEGGVDRKLECFVVKKKEKERERESDKFKRQKTLRPFRAEEIRVLRRDKS